MSICWVKFEWRQSTKTNNGKSINQ